MTSAATVPARPAPAARARLRAAFVLWAVNALVSAAIGTAWLAHAPPGLAPHALVFLLAALLSTAAMIAALAGLPLAAAALVLPRPRTLALLQGGIWTLLQLALLVDTRLYNMFRYHFNGMVWNVITTPGSEDSLEFGGRLIALVALGSAACFALEAGLALWLLRRGPPPRLVRAARWTALALLAAVLVEKGLYARADLVRDRQVSTLSRIFPLYRRLTVKRFATRTLGMRLEDRAELSIPAEGLLLDYPLEWPRIDSAGPRPNVLVVVIDSLRRDVLTEEVAPRIQAFAAGGRRFEDHRSGGNATRYGIFSLLYGLHGTYWMPVYEERRPPALLEALRGLGYEMRVLSSASMNFPEFRSTAWAGMESAVEDAFEPPDKHARDALVAERFSAWIGERPGRMEARPFFCFALLDSPHQAYSVPPGEAPFQPYASALDYHAISGRPDADAIERVWNRYRNAVHHADAMFGRMLDALEREGLAGDTVVVVTGDHGEEFFENGFFGHTSAFSAVQTAVGFALRGPGIPPGIETRPTAHVDLAPTLLELLGADPAARGRWSLGLNLLAPPEERRRVMAGWEEAAIEVPGGYLWVPLEGHKGLVEAYDLRWALHPEADALIAREGAAIARLAEECRRFLR